MEIVVEAVKSFFQGTRDCANGFYLLITKYMFPKNNGLSRENIERLSVRDCHYQGNARSKLYECFAFGLYFVLSHIIFDHYLLQSAFIQLVEWAEEDVNSTSVLILYNILQAIFFVLWILPLLCLSKFLNFNWYQDIANFVLLNSGQKKQEDIKMSDFYADQIKSLVLQMIFCVQGILIYVPQCPLPFYVQHVWYSFHCALLSSLYAFEYKWVHKGFPLQRRLSNIATKWPYHLGFGILLAGLSFCFSSFLLNLIVFATLFPVYVIGSSYAHDLNYPTFRYPFHVFKIADCLSDWLIIKVALNFLNITLGST